MGDILVLVVSLIAAGGALYVILRPQVLPVDGSSAGSSTSWGPLDPADRELLVKVRQAGLWEIPTGQQAQQRARSRKVMAAAGHIAEQHVELDAEVLKIAARLSVVLPSRPSADQQRWMTELSAKAGDDYDRTFVYRLRSAHGKVYMIVAKVRATTRNSMVQRFSEHVMKVVLGHMRMLEGTGLVDYSRMQ